MSIDISVIVTIYNKADFLAECLTSLVKQTKKEIEIIAVDDGSTDASPIILDSFSKDYPMIRVITQKNKGLAGARIAGFQNAKGKYIGYVDADDFVKPKMYETLFNLAEEQQADLVYCDYDFYPEQSSTKPKWFREYKGVKDWKFIDKNTSFCFKLIRKDLLDAINIVELLQKYGDYSPIVAMLEANKIAYTNEHLYFYRMGHTSMSGGDFIGKVAHYHQCCVVTKAFSNVIIGKPYEKNLKEYFEYRYIYSLLLLALVAAKNEDQKEYTFAQQELRRLNYRNNQYTYIAVRESYGAIKAFVLTQVIPWNYLLAKVISKKAI